MSFKPDTFYHVFNRGNNKQLIFFSPSNYIFFLRKIVNEVLPACDLVCYCLMPNHYHLMLYFAHEHVNFRQCIRMENLERKLGTLQSSYTRAINHQEKRVGSLFQPRLKVVEIGDEQQARNCFHYIHHNPVKAKLVTRWHEWKYSSFHEYYGSFEGICRRDIVYGKLQIAIESSLFLEQLEAYRIGRGKRDPDSGVELV